MLMRTRVRRCCAAVYLVVLPSLLLMIRIDVIGAFSTAAPPARTKTEAGSSDPNRASINRKTTSSDNEDSSTLGRMQQIHNDEVSRGRELFDVTTDATTTTRIQSWKDDDFITHSLGQGNAGTDATYLDNGDTVFQSQQPIVTREECLSIIEEARVTIAQGLLQEDAGTAAAIAKNGIRNNRSRTNSQLGEATLSSMPKARQWLQETLQTRFLPLLENRFGVSDLVLYDGLVLGTHAPSRAQPIHRDASLLTLNVALSPLDDYDGGGTYIEAIDTTLKIEQGHLLCHAGGAMHAGVGISRGERWVLVLFVLGGEQRQSQLARRCHAHSLDCLQKQELDAAESVLRAGLQIAPHDHLLHSTMGRAHLQQNHHKLAFRYFQQADTAYPVCQKAMISMAQIFMDQHRPRAALRRFNTVLSRIQDRDLEPSAMMSLKSLAWAARRDAAHCALLCADHVVRTAQQQKEQQHDLSNSDDDNQPQQRRRQQWVCHHLPVAIDRIKTCLVPAPNDPALNGMLARAEFLLEQSQ